MDIPNESGGNTGGDDRRVWRDCTARGGKPDCGRPVVVRRSANTPVGPESTRAYAFSSALEPLADANALKVSATMPAAFSPLIMSTVRRAKGSGRGFVASRNFAIGITALGLCRLAMPSIVSAVRTGNVLAAAGGLKSEKK